MLWKFTDTSFGFVQNVVQRAPTRSSMQMTIGDMNIQNGAHCPLTGYQIGGQHAAELSLSGNVLTYPTAVDRTIRYELTVEAMGGSTATFAASITIDGCRAEVDGEKRVTLDGYATNVDDTTPDRTQLTTIHVPDFQFKEPACPFKEYRVTGPGADAGKVRVHECTAGGEAKCLRYDAAKDGQIAFTLHVLAYGGATEAYDSNINVNGCPAVVVTAGDFALAYTETNPTRSTMRREILDTGFPRSDSGCALQSYSLSGADKDLLSVTHEGFNAPGTMRRWYLNYPTAAEADYEYTIKVTAEGWKSFEFTGAITVSGCPTAAISVAKGGNSQTATSVGYTDDSGGLKLVINDALTARVSGPQITRDANGDRIDVGDQLAAIAVPSFSYDAVCGTLSYSVSGPDAAQVTVDGTSLKFDTKKDRYLRFDLDVTSTYAGSISTQLVSQPGYDVSETDKEILEAVNALRSQPQSFVAKLRAMRANFNNLLYTDPDDGWKITTEEGVAAVDEAIAYLQAATPLKRVTWNQYLGFTCKDMVLSQGAAGLVGPKDASGQTLEAIYKAKYGTTTEAGQSLHYGARPTTTVTSTAGEKIVLQLLIDDTADG